MNRIDKGDNKYDDYGNCNDSNIYSDRQMLYIVKDMIVKKKQVAPGNEVIYGQLPTFF